MYCQMRSLGQKWAFSFLMPILWLVFDAQDFAGLALICLFSCVLWWRTDIRSGEDVVLDDKCVVFCALALAVAHLLYWGFSHFVPIVLPDGDNWLPWLRSELRPEPMESLTWLISLFFLPVIAIALYMFKFARCQRTLATLLLSGCLFWLVEGRSRTSAYYELWHLPILLIGLYMICFVGVWRHAMRNGLKFSRLSSILIGLIPIAASVSHFLSTWDPCFRFGHMDVHMGMIFHQLALDSKKIYEIHQYGFYHLWLKYLFDFIGYTVQTVSGVMCVLLIISAMSFFVGIARLLERRWLLLFFMLSFACCWPESFGHNIYWQYHPIRTLFPMLVVCCWSWTVAREARPCLWKEILVLIVSTSAIFWNFDYGVVVFLSSLVFVAGIELVGFVSVRDVCWRVVADLAVVGGMLFLGYVFIVIQSGDMCWFMSCLRFQKDFYGSGFYMLPIGNMFMSDAWAVLVVYLAGFWHGFSLMFNRPRTQVYRGVFLLSFSVMALGMMTYYQGRSHPEVLTSVMWPTFAIVVLLMDDFLRIYHTPDGVRRPWSILALGVMLLWMALPFSQLQRPGSAILFFFDKEHIGPEHPFRQQLTILDRLIADNRLRDFNVFTSAYQAQFYFRLPVKPVVSGLNYHTVFFCDQLKEICRQMFNASSKCPFLLDMTQNCNSDEKSYMPRTADFLFDGFATRTKVERDFLIIEHGGYMLGVPVSLLIKGFNFEAFRKVRFEPGDKIVSMGVPLTENQLAIFDDSCSPAVKNVVVDRSFGGGISAVCFQ